MNKSARILLIGLAVTLSVYAIARISGVLSFYRVATPSNEPALKMDQWLFASNLKHPVDGDIVTFTHPFEDTIVHSYDSGVKYGQHYIYRFCATENETVQMKAGVLFVNGINADEGRNLYHIYYFDAKDFSAIEAVLDKDDESNNMKNTADSLSPIVNLTSEMIRKMDPKVKLTLATLPPDTSRYGIFMWNGKNAGKWTTDNFGPLQVPEGYCFVLGDNRTNALDSRYTGFIRLADIKGVMIWRK